MERRHLLIFPLKHPEKFERNVEYDELILDFCYGKIPSVSFLKKIKKIIKRILHMN